MIIDKAIETEVIRRLVGYECEMNIPEIYGNIGGNSDIFFTPSYQKLYDDLYAFIVKGNISFSAVSEFCLSSKHFEGYAEYLEFIGNTSYNPNSNTTLYRLLKENQLKRQLLTKAEMIKLKTIDKSVDVFDIIFQLQKELGEMTEELNSVEACDKQLQIKELQTYLRNKTTKPGDLDGLSVRIRAIDSFTRGLSPGRLYIIAGRPAQGKTSFVLRLAQNIASLNNTLVDFYSLEMSSQEILVRLISQKTGLPSNVITSGRANDNEFASINKAIDDIGQNGLLIDDSSSIDIWHIKQSILKRTVENRPQVVIIDYLQLMKMEKGSNREQEVSNTITGLKNLAKDLKIPIIVLSQLNRANEARADKRPMLADLRESGAIEQAADMVMFVHRPEYYGIVDDGDKDLRGMAEIIVAKNRFGSTGIAKLRFNAPTTDFSEKIN